MAGNKELQVDAILEEAIGKTDGISWNEVQEIYEGFRDLCQRSGLTPKEALIVQLASPYLLAPTSIGCGMDEVRPTPTGALITNLAGEIINKDRKGRGSRDYAATNPLAIFMSRGGLRSPNMPTS